MNDTPTPAPVDLTPEVLARWEELAENATQGPWKVWAMQVLADPAGSSNLDDALPVADTTDPTRGLRTFNADFIASARTAVPVLLSGVRSRDARIAELEAEVSGSEERAQKAYRVIGMLEAIVEEARGIIGNGWGSEAPRSLLAARDAEKWWEGVTAQWEHRPLGNRILQTECPYRAGADQ